MQWWLYEKQKEAENPGISLWLLIFTYVVVITFCLFIRATTWPNNKHIDALFFLPALALPFLIITALMCFVNIFKSALVHYAEMRKFIALSQEYHLKQYARKNVIIAGWSVITPLEQPALNLLKLEGEFPLAPKNPLKIRQEQGFDYTRIEQIFGELIGPLATKLKNHNYRGFKTTLWVRGGDEYCCDELQRMLGQFDINHNSDCQIEYLSGCPDYSLINTWIKQSETSRINRLIFIIDIYGDDSDSKSMESACALLLTNRYVKIESEKPVYLYQPMAGVNDIEAKVPVYLQTAPVVSPKTLWYTGLSRAEKYPLLKALDEQKQAPERLDIEASLGERSAGYRWLALALAADAVKYAQGGQLVAVSENNQFSIAALSSRQPPEPDDFKGFEHTQPWLFGGMSGILLMLSFWVYQFSFFDSKNPFSLWGFIAGSFTPLIVGGVIGIFATWYSSKNACADMGW
ncbi:hypothetical protein [Klebsiella michiganensis]|uniref:hypothetical protein n=1 Tax=Klebsiella michiganensis TaxID=1134687 RepID=UPI00066677EA|nr:hypothetical protein [Klebsiella michiganensis]